MRPENAKFLLAISAIYCLVSAVGVTRAAAPVPLPKNSTGAAFSQTSLNNDNNDALADLLQVLDEETAIATKTKLNIDFVPGMVTVLHGVDLRAKGVRSVYEALGLVPGIELSMSGGGQPQFLVRGLGKTFTSDKIKFLLNGVDLNTTLGPNIAVHTLPIEQIERIDVIRGPGSAVYGEHALAGVVDIITLHHSNSGFVRFGDTDGLSIGAVYSDHSADGRFGFDLNVAGTEIKSAGMPVQQDSLPQPLSNTPGITNEREADRSLILNLHYGATTLLAQHLRSAFGDYFGVNNVLPEERTDAVHTMTTNTLEARRFWTLGQKTRVDTRLGWSHFSVNTDNQQLFPAGYHGEFLQSGVLGGPHYEEARASAKASLEFSLGRDHHLVASAEYSEVIQGNTWNNRNFDPNLLGIPRPPGPSAEVPQQHYTGAENWLEEGLSRAIFSSYLQDQFSGLAPLALTLGVRLDRYDDGEDHITPRIAAVYPLSAHRTVKLQYSDSFRPPSFLEMYARNNPRVNGNPDIKPEHLHNYEVGYIHNDGHRVGRITAYLTSVSSVIVVDPDTRRYNNSGDVQIHGIELEAQLPILAWIKLDANFSYNDNDSHGKVNALWGTARRHANVGALCQVMTRQYVDIRYRYVGTRDRETGDNRAELAGYNTISLTYNAERVIWPQLSVRAGIRNIMDTNVVYPAPMNTYADDYPRPGRQWWMSAGYKF